MGMPAKPLLDLTAIVVCTLAWGTTWFAITLQFGTVDPIVSVVYRFALAAAVLFAWCVLRKEKIALTRAQHVAVFGIGVFTFAIDYAFVYWAEERVVSAMVAVIFAALAFVNLVLFRIVFKTRAAPLAWLAAVLGVGGVALLSWSEIAGAAMDARALTGIALAVAGLLGAAIGNAYAHRAEAAGAGVAASTAWAMLYGTALLALFAVATGRAWSFSWTPQYIFSLLHLSIVGSVIAFALYFGLARRRGYATAAYIGALTPILAMGMSAAFEHKTWGLSAFAGLALILAGQFLLMRTRRA
jgi:drug/metabolite transporter (DMT)-like permease